MYSLFRLTFGDFREKMRPAPKKCSPNCEISPNLVTLFTIQIKSRSCQNDVNGEAQFLWKLRIVFSRSATDAMIFENIFAKKISENVGIFGLKLLLVSAKIKSLLWFLRKTPNFFRRKL
jgi:hypothetical protein